jgi:predicted aspartyl protease
MRKFWLIPIMALGLLGAATPSADVTADDPASPIVAANDIAPDFTKPQTEVLDLAQERHERLTLPVTIDGSGPYQFMIDTGSQATAVTQGINESLGLESLGMATLVGMASRRPVEVVELDRLEFGSNVIHNLAAPVLNRTHVGADGILGLDTLQDFRVLLDFRNETIAVQDVTRDKASQSGFDIIVRARHNRGQLLITDAKVEGVKAIVIIDTGAQTSMANLALRDRIRTKRAHDIITTDVNGVQMLGALTYVRSLQIEGLELSNVPLTFADAPAFEALGLKDKPVLSLGMRHLRMFDRVAIDFSRRRVLFDVPRAVQRELRRNRPYGWNL